MRCSTLLLSTSLLAWFASFASAQLSLEPLPHFAIAKSPLAIVRDAEPAKPFTVAGEHGAILGQQNGECEAWIFPVKVISQFQITAELKDYPVPIEVNELPGSIEVNPGRTTITYSHAAFTIRQHMFSPRGTGSAPVIFFEFASIRPMQLTFRFTPVVQRMWPAPTFGRPNAEWVANGNSGYYVLHTDNDELSAAIAIPGAQAGILQPYQERPKIYPVEFKLTFDPAKDANSYFPVLLAVGAGNAALGKQLAALNKAIPELYASTQDHYTQLLSRSVEVESPDKLFDQAIQWAIVSIDQMQVIHAGNETGMVAGYYSSGDSARPGFGWFFGRDTLWTLYGVNAYGGFDLTKRSLDFIFSRQREDGKVMHEYSQTAEFVNWKSLPYLYASADSTCLLIMAMDDYVSTSGDVEYLKTHWDALQRAYTFIRQHDSDGDGIYENTEGTGWVESWPSGMPHQEIYLAALDQESANSMSRLAALIGNKQLASSAADLATKIREKIESEYYDASRKFYSFSRNADGSTDQTQTIYPAVAWWTGRLALAKSGDMFAQWASQEFSTDWGTRDVGLHEKFFDPISYHQGSVWPLFTGWASLAEFRAGRSLSGTAHLMQNLNLTFAQDLGSVTELLSGMFFQPLGRSSSHQLWSSAMVLSPALRGLFGFDFDAPHKTLRVSPHLPASWDRVVVHHVPLGDQQLEIEMLRTGGNLVIHGSSAAPTVFCLVSQFSDSGDCSHPARTREQLAIPLPGAEIELPNQLPAPGSLTGQMKVINEEESAHQSSFTFEAPAGTTQMLKLRQNRKKVSLEGGTAAGNQLQIVFPNGTGLKQQTLTFHW